MFEVSVITPIHNVDIDIFKSCVKSMKDQTLGFKNVHWIIILHNCSKQCTSVVKKLLSRYNNVDISILNNDVHSPASPRNFGLKKIKAPFVGFLDADDMYTPNCLEVSLREIKDSKAQILGFRRDHYMENQNLRLITEKIKWNQAEDRIIVNPKTCDKEKLYSETFYMITSKIFDTSFLRKHNLIFDIKSPVGTDFLFSLDCFAKAKRICFLPRFIGYTYYINSKSVAQHKMKDDAEFIHFAKGVKMSVDAHKKYGIKSDAAQGLCYVVAFQILNNPNISCEARAEVKKLFANTMAGFKLQQPDKFYTQHRLLERYWISKIVLNHPNWSVEKFYQMINGGLINLLTILKTNQNTDFGQKYGFNRINSIGNYQSKVPVSTPDFVASVIDLQNRVGEENILTCGRPSNYIKKKDGTILMTTKSHLDPYINALDKTLQKNTTFFVARYSNSNDKKSTDNVYIRNFSDVLLRNYFWNYREALEKKQSKLTSKDAFYFMDINKEDYYKSLVKDAISNKNLTQIVALNTQELFYVFKIMKECFPRVNFKKAWPKLKKICVFDNKLSEKAKTKICEFFNISYCSTPFYFTEESILGTFDEKSLQFSNFFGDSFIEILPENSKINNPIDLSKAKKGEIYRLIITNSAGLYRYYSNYRIKIKNNKSGKISYNFL